MVLNPTGSQVRNASLRVNVALPVFWTGVISKANIWREMFTAKSDVEDAYGKD